MIYVIINPHSRVNILNKNLEYRFSKILGNNGRVFVTKTLGDQDKVIEEARDNNVEVIGVCGGDGTVSKTLSAVYKIYPKDEKKYPNILFLKGGTINFLSHNIPGKPTATKTLEWYIDKISRKEELNYKDISTLRVDDNLGFMFVDGVGYNFLKLFYSNKTNALGSFLLLLKVCGSSLFKLKGFSWVFDKDETQSSFTEEGKDTSIKNSETIFISSLKNIAYGISFFKTLEPFCFQVDFFNVKKGLSLIKALIFCLLEKNSKYKKIKKLNRISIDSSRYPYDYSLDGELLKTDKQLDIEIGPTFKFISIK